MSAVLERARREVAGWAVSGIGSGVSLLGDGKRPMRTGLNSPWNHSAILGGGGLVSDLRSGLLPQMLPVRMKDQRSFFGDRVGEGGGERSK